MQVIPYGRQKIEEADIDAVVRTLKSDFLTQGPAVAEFEKSVTDYLKKIAHDSSDVYALAVNNGTSALQLACMALQVKAGDRVLVTANSFAASANCVRYMGGEVEFIDISLVDYNLDLDALEQKLKQSPANTYTGVVAVSFAGYPVDLKRLREICDRHQLWIIEDACHAIGGVSQRPNEVAYASGSGKYADIAVMSFHPVKHIATGEGGMVLTRSPKLYEHMKLLRTHGITKDPAQMSRIDGGWYYEMQELGYNFRISDILCSLGTSQMSRIDTNLASRRAIAQRYDEALASLPLTLVSPNSSILHAYHLYVIRVQGGREERKNLYEHLKKNGIYAQVHYIPIHQFPYYVGRYGHQKFERCDAYYDSCLSIPMYHSMSEAEQDHVIEVVRKFFA